VEARYADVTLPSITLHEAVTARRTSLAKGRREVDSRALVRSAIAPRELVENATRKTGAARRGGGPKPKSDDDGWGSLRGVDSSPLSRIRSEQDERRDLPFDGGRGRAPVRN